MSLSYRLQEIERALLESQKIRRLKIMGSLVAITMVLGGIYYYKNSEQFSSIEILRESQDDSRYNTSQRYQSRSVSHSEKRVAKVKPKKRIKSRNNKKKYRKAKLTKTKKPVRKKLAAKSAQKKYKKPVKTLAARKLRSPVARKKIAQSPRKQRTVVARNTNTKSIKSHRIPFPKSIISLSNLTYSVADLANCESICSMAFRTQTGRTFKGIFYKDRMLSVLSQSHKSVNLKGGFIKSGEFSITSLTINRGRVTPQRTRVIASQDLTEDDNIQDEKEENDGQIVDFKSRLRATKNKKTTVKPANQQTTPDESDDEDQTSSFQNRLKQTFGK